LGPAANFGIFVDQNENTKLKIGGFFIFSVSRHCLSPQYSQAHQKLVRQGEN
jgi:hypothetical protein